VFSLEFASELYRLTTATCRRNLVPTFVDRGVEGANVDGKFECKRKNNLSCVPYGGLVPGETGRLTVGCITLTFSP
jgi:hypothetical protein